MAGLASVIPTLRGRVADRGTETRQRGDLAQPAANEDGLEVAGVAGCHDLTHGARVQLVDELAVGVGGGFVGVALQHAALLEVGEAHLLAPLVDDANVARAGA